MRTFAPALTPLYRQAVTGNIPVGPRTWNSYVTPASSTVNILYVRTESNYLYTSFCKFCIIIQLTSFDNYL